MRNFLMLLFLLFVSFNSFAGAGTFPQGDHVKLLKDKIEFKNSTKQIISEDATPTLTSVDASAGSLLMNSNGYMFAKRDNGDTTNWVNLLIDFTPIIRDSDSDTYVGVELSTDQDQVRIFATDNEVGTFTATESILSKVRVTNTVTVSGTIVKSDALEGEILRADSNGEMDSVFQTATYVKVSNDGSSTYDRLSQVSDIINSSGILSGGVISDAGGGLVNVSEGKALIRATNSATAEMVSITFPASSSISLPNDLTSYLYVDYNSGSPIVKSSTSNVANSRTTFNLGIVFREGLTDIKFLNAGLDTSEIIKRVQSRINAVNGMIERASGMTVTATESLGIESSAGVFYAGLSRLTTTSKDSLIDGFEYYYLLNGVWTETDDNAIDNTQYNDVSTPGSESLATLSNHSYGVHWVYIDVNSNILVVYGQDKYSKLSDAEDAAVPNVTYGHISDMSILCAKIIIFKGDTTFTKIESAFDVPFRASVVTDHDDLAGLDTAGTGVTYGHINDTTQTISGEKTFSDGINVTTSATINELNVTTTASIGGNLVVRPFSNTEFKPTIISDNVDDTGLYIDPLNDRVGVFNEGGQSALFEDGKIIFYEPLIVKVAGNETASALEFMEKDIGFYVSSQVSDYDTLHITSGDAVSTNKTAVTFGTTDMLVFRSFYVTKDASISDTLNVTGGTTLSDTLSVGSTLSLVGIQNSNDPDYSLGIIGDEVVKFPITSGSPFTDIEVTGTATINNLAVTNTSTFYNDVLASEDLTIGATLELSGIQTNNTATEVLVIDSVTNTIYKKNLISFPVNLYDNQVYYHSLNGDDFTDRTGWFEWDLTNTATFSNSGEQILVASDDSANNRTKYTAQKESWWNVCFNYQIDNAGANAGFFINDVYYGNGSDENVANSYVNTCHNMHMDANDYLTIGSVRDGSVIFAGEGIRNGAQPTNLTIKAFALKDGVVNSGTIPENNYAARITSADVITTQNPNFISSVSSGSTGIYVITYTTDLFSVTPSVVANAETDGLYSTITSESASGCTINIKDDSGTLTDSDFTLHLKTQGNDFKSISGTIITPSIQIAYLKDVKSAGTGGGNSSTSFTTRDLNTVEGDTSIVSLSSNQFTLGAGKYDIEFSGPTYKSGNTQAVLYNVTDSSNDIIGAGANGNTTDGHAISFGKGQIEITSSKTYEIKQICQSAVATTGFGNAAGHTGFLSNVFTQVKITKLK